MTKASPCRALRRLLAGLLTLFAGIPAFAEGASPLAGLNMPERGVFPQTVGRLRIRDEDSRYISFVEVEGEEVYRTVMDCHDWRSRRYSVNRARPYDANSYFQENQRSRNLILIQAQYCPQIAQLPILRIDYDKGMRKQVYQDRSLVPAEYFLKCPLKDAQQWPCIDHRDAWDEQRWDPRQDPQKELPL